jgi:signal transduction histidine kinase
MLRFYSLRSRLIVTYVSLMILGLGALAVLAGQQIYTSAYSDFQDQVDHQLQLIAQQITPSMEAFNRGLLSQADLIAAVDKYNEQLGGRVMLLDAASRPLFFDTGAGDNSVEGSQNPGSSDRQDVAHNPQRDLGDQPIIETSAAVYDDGRLIGFVHLSVPTQGVQQTIAQRWQLLGLGAGAIILMVVGASIRLASSLSHPLVRLRETALKVASGDFSQRVPVDRQDEIGAVSKAFNHMAVQVSAMLEEQRAFASNASHELRTPLTTIRLRVEALQHDNLADDKRQQYTAEIEQELARLTELVDDVMLLARVDAGRAAVGHEHIDFGRFARSLIRDFTPLAEARGVELQLQCSGELPSVEASLNHLNVVFRNVLDYALKYTPSGGRITWQITTRDTSIENVIRDTGQGISSEALPLVFQRFYREDEAHTREVSGNGLGLALVQAVLKLYNGTIQIASAGKGKGSTVTVHWPLPAFLLI